MNNNIINNNTNQFVLNVPMRAAQPTMTISDSGNIIFGGGDLLITLKELIEMRQHIKDLQVENTTLKNKVEDLMRRMAIVECTPYSGIEFRNAFEEEFGITYVPEYHVAL